MGLRNASVTFDDFFPCIIQSLPDGKTLGCMRSMPGRVTSTAVKICVVRARSPRVYRNLYLYFSRTYTESWRSFQWSTEYTWLRSRYPSSTDFDLFSSTQVFASGVLCLLMLEELRPFVRRRFICLQASVHKTARTVQLLCLILYFFQNAQLSLSHGGWTRRHIVQLYRALCGPLVSCLSVEALCEAHVVFALPKVYQCTANFSRHIWRSHTCVPRTAKYSMADGT